MQEAVKNTIAENMGGVAHAFAKDEHKFDIDKDVPSQEGKVAVITGGSEGIGYGAGFTLLKNSLSKLFVVSMSQEVMNGALKDISDQLGAEYARKVVFIKCDLADWPAVAKAAKEIASQTDRLDTLVLNSARGIMTYQLTDYSVDRHMAVNHIGHVVLTSHLLPLLKSTASSGATVRISIQASNAHEMAPKDTKFASLDELNRDLGPNPLYGRSKLASILYARYLTRHLHAAHPQILANATHPGFVETKMSVEDIHEPYPVAGYGMSVLMKPLKKDQWMGAASTLYCSTATQKSGEYICPPATPEPGSELARSDELGEQLMKLTRELVREKFGEESVGKGCPLRDY
jgi:NAD(P)-dependent dehydrogenase (short-subunit alcohol dehydrogenase family)